jgi:thiamine biosynthesis lipoprotein
MLLAIALVCVGRLHAQEPPHRHEFQQVLMGMDFKLTFYAANSAAAKRAADAAFGRVAELNAILSDYDPASELSRLSATAGRNRWVAVSPDLWFVLRRSDSLARKTDGAFDVTVGPLTRLWRRARRQRELPSAERLRAALAAVGYQFVEFNPAPRAIKLQQPGMRLDLGGIAAGYAADEALAVLRQHGCSRALVDASGDIVTGEPPPGEAGWRIALPGETNGDSTPRYLKLKHAAVTTSGDTAQFVEIGGKRYSHIVDPRTGLGLTSRLRVTVIGPDCITADSVATAVSVLGPQRGLALVRETPGTECLIADADTQRVLATSEGFERSFIARD